MWIIYGFNSKCAAVVAGNTMQDGGLVVMGENNSLRVFESSPISPIVDE